MIHLTAIVDSGAKIGANVEVGPHSTNRWRGHDWGEHEHRRERRYRKRGYHRSW